MSLFELLRNKVNRERKRCRKSYNKAKVQQLSESKPHDWWREMKQLCGLKTEQKNLRSILRITVMIKIKISQTESMRHLLV